MHLRFKKSRASAVLLATATIVMAGCSTSSPASGGSTQTASSTSSTASGGGGTQTASSTSSAASGGNSTQSADLAAAKAYLAPYTVNPTKLLNTEPLKSLPPAGSTVAYLDGGTPIQAAFWQALQPTAPILGIKLSRIPTGSTAQSINSALDSVVESKPAAVINVAVDPTLFSRQLGQLRAEGVKVVSATIVNGPKFGFANVLSNAGQVVYVGKALTSAAIVRTKGEASKFVFYTVPELPFAGLELQGAQDQMKAQCPNCTMRVVNVPVTTLGSTAADVVVSDLQAHPDTQYFLAALDEVQIGLPSKLKVAGIDVKGVGATPAAANLQQIAAGQEDAGIALDLNLFTWTAMDQAMREVLGQTVTYPDDATTAAATHHLITKENAVPDPQVGWTAIADYQAQFKKLWTGK